MMTTILHDPAQLTEQQQQQQLGVILFSPVTSQQWARRSRIASRHRSHQRSASEPNPSFPSPDEDDHLPSAAAIPAPAPNGLLSPPQPADYSSSSSSSSSSNVERHDSAISAPAPNDLLSPFSLADSSSSNIERPDSALSTRSYATALTRQGSLKSNRPISGTFENMSSISEVDDQSTAHHGTSLQSTPSPKAVHLAPAEASPTHAVIPPRPPPSLTIDHSPELAATVRTNKKPPREGLGCFSDPGHGLPMHNHAKGKMPARLADGNGRRAGQHEGDDDGGYADGVDHSRAKKEEEQSPVSQMGPSSSRHRLDASAHHIDPEKSGDTPVQPRNFGSERKLEDGLQSSTPAPPTHSKATKGVRIPVKWTFAFTDASFPLAGVDCFADNEIRESPFEPDSSKTDTPTAADLGSSKFSAMYYTASHGHHERRHLELTSQLGLPAGASVGAEMHSSKVFKFDTGQSYFVISAERTTNGFRIYVQRPKLTAEAEAIKAEGDSLAWTKVYGHGYISALQSRSFVYAQIYLDNTFQMDRKDLGGGANLEATVQPMNVSAKALLGSSQGDTDQTASVKWDVWSSGSNMPIPLIPYTPKMKVKDILPKLMENMHNFLVGANPVPNKVQVTRYPASWGMTHPVSGSILKSIQELWKLAEDNDALATSVKFRSQANAVLEDVLNRRDRLDELARNASDSGSELVELQNLRKEMQKDRKTLSHILRVQTIRAAGWGSNYSSTAKKTPQRLVLTGNTPHCLGLANIEKKPRDEMLENGLIIRVERRIRLLGDGTVELVARSREGQAPGHGIELQMRRKNSRSKTFILDTNDSQQLIVGFGAECTAGRHFGLELPCDNKGPLGWREINIKAICPRVARWAKAVGLKTWPSSKYKISLYLIKKSEVEAVIPPSHRRSC
ncbi:hypothetical protein OC846_006478 [Tilletia horrida]|uniref:Uncharacterized protein n=1 Tax=Tilletia horrida TaxID=155126 RepID=A0AAN6JV09_9BASI|nr:hypothetical protein OC846_006478 [Tilletia horrida]KAK0559724.1 hypothetical protein OC861_006550 [Tilletia horrida]